MMNVEHWIMFLCSYKGDCLPIGLPRLQIPDSIQIQFTTIHFNSIAGNPVHLEDGTV